jgi:hypothetical protein
MPRERPIAGRRGTARGQGYLRPKWHGRVQREKGASAMSRRIISKRTIAAYEKAGVAAPQTQPDGYLSRLIKYIPSEVIAIFLVVNSLAAGQATIGGVKVPFQLTDQQYFIAFAVFLVITPIYVWRVTSVPKMKPATGQIIISIISFATWAYATGKPFTHTQYYNPLLAAVLVPVVALLAGLIDPNPQIV